MIHHCFERIDRIKAIEREYRVVRHATERLIIANADDRAELPPGISSRDLLAASSQLEATFLIRIWAEFETATRSYYAWIHNEVDPRIRAIDLVNSLAGSRLGRAVTDLIRLQVHEVREYRNSLVHDRDKPTSTVSLADARRRLNTFLGAKLPEHWG